MQRLEVSGAKRPLYGSLGVKGLKEYYFAVYITPLTVVANDKTKEISGHAEVVY